MTAQLSNAILKISIDLTEATFAKMLDPNFSAYSETQSRNEKLDTDNLHEVNLKFRPFKDFSKILKALSFCYMKISNPIRSNP